MAGVMEYGSGRVPPAAGWPAGRNLRRRFETQHTRWWVGSRGLLAWRSDRVWTLKSPQRTGSRLEYFEDARESVYRCRSDGPKSGSRHSVGLPTAPLRPDERVSPALHCTTRVWPDAPALAGIVVFPMPQGRAPGLANGIASPVMIGSVSGQVTMGRICVCQNIAP
jgi:hypothetical protein